MHGVRHPALSFVMLRFYFWTYKATNKPYSRISCNTQNYFTLNVLFVAIKELKATNISYSRILCYAHKYFAIPVDTSIV